MSTTNEQNSGSDEQDPGNFIRSIIAQDLAAGKNAGKLVTRFPPEPNGYLHIGHAKAICISFGLAADFGGTTNLRFDDTNPMQENIEYILAIKDDITWLGFSWHAERYASDYFEDLYQLAERLVQEGKAYVDSLKAEQIREYRGTLTSPGTDSPYRKRNVAENLDLFRKMRAGAFAEGEQVLRLKIDMASPNINMRDPVIYRIQHVQHHRTKDAWCVYPLYDYTHCLCDSFEGITHSLCDLGFEDHRPLYDWVLDALAMECHPKQIEFSRLSLQYTVTSKRKIKQLIDEGGVAGWDDPRLPTLSGLRRRGYTPASIRDFCRRIGVTKSDNRVELAFLQSCLRDDLEHQAPRVMGVLEPLKLVLDNYPEGASETNAKAHGETHGETLSLANHPKDEALGRREVNFTKVIYIDRNDFRESANRKYKRLVTGGEVRLRYAYVVKAHAVVKDESGKIIEVHCTYDPDTLGKNPVDRKVRGVIHWVSATQGIPAEIRCYAPLFVTEFPDSTPQVQNKALSSLLNPESLQVYQGIVEPSLLDAGPEDRFQFEREGYFCLDSRDSSPQSLVFNRIVGLKDTWAKLEQSEAT